ncbi:endo alpha-1,4 polygalactosaminidase [Robbsia sp. KACC 23696]|uniref:endo alpha-1,4 polygalactosaminidase n=1 Tax=Robbsia sp. KACC 23696 TaxID=3149231 RepID=UPI00325B7B13
MLVTILWTGFTVTVGACGGGGSSSNDDSSSAGGASASSAAAVPGTLSASVAGSPWLTYYGRASAMGSLATVADTFHIIDVDLDPGLGTFTSSNVTTLKNGGKNLVLSYLNIGSCESFRTYWSTVPSGYVSCSANTAAQLGSYSGFSNETWMNPANADYQNLIVNYVAPQLVAQGADGFFLDNMEIVEHGTATSNGPCNAACAQGGLDLVRMLRAKYPSLVIVMQNATGNVTRLGTTGGVPFASLLDGITHESVYAPSYDATAEAQLLAWQGMQLTPNGHPLWIATLDYVGSCAQTSAAQTDYQRSRAKGFVPYASDKSSGLNVVCYWGF